MKWENIAITELEFYKNSFKNMERLKAAIEAIDEDDCFYPTITVYREDEGRTFFKSPDVEEIVINRLMKKEMFENGIERLKRKVSLIEQALNLLTKDERDIIEYSVLYPGEYDLTTIGELIGLSGKERILRFKRKALLRFYRFLRLEKGKRKQAIKERLVKDQHQEAIDFMKKQQAKELLEKKQRQLFIQSIKDKQKTS